MVAKEGGETRRGQRQTGNLALVARSAMQSALPAQRMSNMTRVASSWEAVRKRRKEREARKAKVAGKAARPEESDPASLREERAASELCGGILTFLKICRMLVDLCSLALPNHCNKEDDFIK